MAHSTSFRSPSFAIKDLLGHVAARDFDAGCPVDEPASVPLPADRTFVGDRRGVGDLAYHFERKGGGGEQKSHR